MVADDEEVFLVEMLLGKKVVKKKKKQPERVLYLVRWQGYGKEHDTWEPADGLPPICISEFEAIESEKELDALMSGMSGNPTETMPVAALTRDEMLGDGMQQTVGGGGGGGGVKGLERTAAVGVDLASAAAAGGGAKNKGKSRSEPPSETPRSAKRGRHNKIDSEDEKGECGQAIAMTGASSREEGSAGAPTAATAARATVWSVWDSILGSGESNRQAWRDGRGFGSWQLDRGFSQYGYAASSNDLWCGWPAPTEEKEKRMRLRAEYGGVAS